MFYIKKKKLFSYIIAAVFALTLSFNAYAEAVVENPLPATETSAPETTPADTSEDSQTEAPETQETTPEVTTEVTPPETTDDTTVVTTEQTTYPPIVINPETTTPPPLPPPVQTTPPPVIEVITTTPKPVVVVTTPKPQTTTPAETVIETEVIPGDITAVTTENEPPATTTTAAETAAGTGGTADPEMPDVVEGDPGGDFITTIILIAVGFVAFVLILVMPSIVKKIKRKIVYKY